MRRVVAHLIITLDGVVRFDAVADAIMKLRDTDEVLDDFFPKVAEEDAMLWGGSVTWIGRRIGRIQVRNHLRATSTTCGSTWSPRH